MKKDKWTYSDGSKYYGEFKDGKRHGKGILIRHDGIRYQGEWHEGKPHGQGTATTPDGRKRIGEWKYGKFVGEAKQSIDKDQKMEKTEESDTVDRHWIGTEDQKEPNTELKAPSSGDKETTTPSDTSNTILSLIVVVVFIVLAVFSTSNYGEEEERSPIENLQIIIDIEREKRRR